MLKYILQFIDEDGLTLSTRLRVRLCDCHPEAAAEEKRLLEAGYSHRVSGVSRPL